MSTALRNVCTSCLRGTLRSRRSPVVAAAVLLPRRALHITAPRPSTPLKITRRVVDDDILSTIGASVPAVDPLFKLPPADIITLKEHLEAGDLSTACSHFMGINITIPSAEELRSAYAGSETSMGDYVPDAALQSVLTQLLGALLATDWRAEELNHPLRLLERMEEMGVCKSDYYVMLLIETIRRFNTPEEILPVFDRAVKFITDTNDLHNFVLDTTEPESIKVDLATPYFFTYLALKGLKSKKESTLRYERAVRHSPYPSPNYAMRFLEYYKFSAEYTERILSLLESYASDTLFTNYYTLSLEISRAKTPEALTDLYKRVVATNPCTPDVYTRFMTAFFEIGCNTEAITCWADMTRAAIIPTVVQWNELLRAYSRTQDKLPIAPVWNMLMRSGCRPDHHCWTTRIHALLDNKNIAAGLAALREMQASDVTPSTATINATLDGLLKHNYITEAEAVMNTAASLGIEKDLVTYNTILKTLMKRQKTDTRTFNSILSLTREMQSSGIVPDITTVTLILDGMYKYATPAPKLETVLGILQYVEDAGIMTNIVTFTTILHALLKEGNEAAAMGILGIMEDRGIVGNSATYTILIQYYFSRSDIVSVERVIAEMESRRVPADPRVYKEIILGYINVREARKMQLWLKKARDGHVMLGLLTYMSVLRAMERKELLLEAKNMVVELMERGLVGGEALRTNESEFWDVVREMAGGAVWRGLEREERVKG